MLKTDKDNAIEIYQRCELKLLLVVFMILVGSSSANEIVTPPSERQLMLFANNCIQCHGRPDTGAPIIGVADDWAETVDRGEDKALVNVVQGIRGMPPLGYCSACSEKDLRVLLRFIANLPHKKGNEQ